MTRSSASITGTNISGEVLTLATLVEISNEALADGRTTFEGAVLEAIVMGLNYRLDWTCFQADGTDDTTDGAMTGIFANAAVPVSTPAAGKVTVASLDVADFAAVIGKVSAAALQWPCSWWISPSLLPALLYLRDGPEFILKRPTVAGGAWLLQGFPVEWTTGAPGADGPGKQLALFGRGAAYSVVLRQEFEIARGGAKFDQILTQLRATMRARCEMRDATAFAILKLPAA